MMSKRITVPPYIVFSSCTIILFLFIIVASLLNHQSIGTMLAFFLYQVFCIFLPGMTLLLLLNIRIKKLLFFLGLSYAIGYCISLSSYIIAILFSFITDSWMKFIPIFNYTFAFLSLIVLGILYFTRKNQILFSDKSFCKTSLSSFSIFVLMWIGTFILYFLCYGLPNRLPGLGSDQAYYPDTLYWIENAISLSRGFPPESIRGVGHILSYHYFSSMQLVCLNKTTFIPISSLCLAYSYIQSSTLLSFGFYFLFKNLFVPNHKMVFAYILLLFSMGDYEGTCFFISSHLISGPFGFDYGIGFSFFIIGLLLLFHLNSQSSKYLFLCTIFIPICIGIKSPIGFLCLGFAGILCLFWLFQKGKNIPAVLAGLITLIISFGVYRVFISGGSSWLQANSSSISNTTTSSSLLSLSWKGTSNYVPIIKEWYNYSDSQLSLLAKIILFFKLLFKYIFRTNMAVVFFATVKLIQTCLHPKREVSLIHVASLITWLVSLYLSLFISMVGYSQGYFIQSAEIYLLVFIFYSKSRMEQKPSFNVSNSFIRIMSIPLVIVCLFNAGYFNYPIVKDAIETISTGELHLSSRFADYTSSCRVTPGEYQGYLWIKNNTVNSSILVTNATLGTQNPLMTGSFAERRMWIESQQSPSVAKDIAEYRISLLKRIIEEDDPLALPKLQAQKVTHLIILTRFQQCPNVTRYLPCLYQNDEIAIYSLQP